MTDQEAYNDAVQMERLLSNILSDLKKYAELCKKHSLTNPRRWDVTEIRQMVDNKLVYARERRCDLERELKIKVPAHQEPAPE